MSIQLIGDGSYDYDIVGELSYQPALERICGGKTAKSARLEVEAVVICENDNPHDPDAVRVDVCGMTVGYFPREDAPDYRYMLAVKGVPEAIATCRAIIVGGWYRGPDDFGYFGVKLDIPSIPAAPKAAKSPRARTARGRPKMTPPRSPVQRGKRASIWNRNFSLGSLLFFTFCTMFFCCCVWPSFTKK